MTARQSKLRKVAAHEDFSTVETVAEEKKVEDRVALSANVVYETIRREGEDELKRSSAALAWSGLAAGLSMGFSLVSEGLLSERLPATPWAQLITHFGYSLGFLIVILGRQQLFTENTLTVILPLLLHKNVATLIQVLRLWSVVLISNLAGTFLFALCLAKTSVLGHETQNALLDVSRQPLAATGFGVVLLRAVFAGWLIALMIWLLPMADSARVSIIVILTYIIGLGGFNHIIAGSTKVFFLVLTGAATSKMYFLNFFLPTFLGNTLGGISLVAFLGHAQVVAGKANPHPHG